MGLDVAGVFKGALNRIGSLPQTFAGEGCPDRGGLVRMIDFEEPVGPVDPVNHEIGEESTTEIPKPSPVSEPKFVEGLGRSVTEEIVPGDLGRVNSEGHATELRRTTSVPGEVDLEDLADPPALYQLARLLNVGHAALLHPDLDNSLAPILGLDNYGTFARLVSQWFFDVDILAGVACVRGHLHVPVVRTAD